MSATNRCPRCQAEIPAGAPEGLCPQCLLQAGLQPRTAGADSKTAAAEPNTAKYVHTAGGFVPPSVAEMQAAFPQFEILELIGKGGMGAVYKARQPRLDRLVAVKILPPEVSQDPAFAQRFEREAQALARLSHANIVAIFDFGQTTPVAHGSPGAAPGGFCYFVMEYVDGVNLRQAMRSRQLSPIEALKIVPQICDALQFAHDEGIVHRDIKPENILLDKKGRVKIADFGLAKLLGVSTLDAGLTGTQQVMGTMNYMAPEQMEGSRDVDHRADIYSLGVTFYEMLTGELPLGRFPAPSKKVHIDIRLDEIVLRSLEREPRQRYQHASDIKTEMETIARGPGQPGTPAAPAQASTVLRPPGGMAARAEKEALEEEAFLKAELTFAHHFFVAGWTVVCVVLFVLFWTPNAEYRAKWSGYLDASYWPYQRTSECTVSLEPSVPTCRSLAIREKMTLTRGGSDKANNNFAFADERPSKLTYQIELQTVKGESRQLVADALNGMSWTADEQSGSLLDAATLAEWLRLGDAGFQESDGFEQLFAPMLGMAKQFGGIPIGGIPGFEGATDNQKKRLIAHAVQARALIDIIRRANDQSANLFQEKGDGKKMSRLHAATDTALAGNPAFVPNSDWNAAENVKWAPVVPILYVGLPLMLVVWGVGYWLLRRNDLRRPRSVQRPAATQVSNHSI